MAYVSCPHCGTELENDGTLAGQAVECPGCRHQLQMPPTAEPIVRVPGRRQKKASLAIVVVLFGGFAVILMFGVLAVALYVSGVFHGAEKSQGKSPVSLKTTKNDPIQYSDKPESKKKEIKTEPKGTDGKTDEEQTKANTKKQMEQLEQLLEARRQEKERRLAELDQNEAAQVIAIENEINQIKKKIATNEQSMARMIAQRKSLDSLPKSKLPNPSREVMEIERKAKEEWFRVQQAYREAQAKFQGDLIAAEQRLKNVRDQFQKKRLSVLAGS